MCVLQRESKGAEALWGLAENERNYTLNDRMRFSSCWSDWVHEMIALLYRYFKTFLNKIFMELCTFLLEHFSWKLDNRIKERVLFCSFLLLLAHYQKAQVLGTG